MVIYHYVDRIWRIIVTPDFCIIYTITNKYYPGEPAHIHMQSFINIMQDKNRINTIKKDKGKLPLFCGNEEQVSPIYGRQGDG